MEFKGNLPSAEPSLSDWDWVKKQIEMDAPIPYDPSNLDDGPNDANEDDAVDRFLTHANRVYPAIPRGDKKIAKAS